jgi:putative nucleotidyltransferase with HDIG domain
MNKEEILNLLPEIKEIKEEALQDKVINVWSDAIAYRNWTVDELQSIPFTLLAENVGISFLEHVRTVCKMCIACDNILTEAYHESKTPVNRDYLIAGALLADVAKLLEFDKKSDGTIYKSDYGKKLRHPFTGVGLAFKYDVPAEVMHIIAVHSKEGAGEQRSPEAIIFHHADFIDFELVK